MNTLDSGVALSSLTRLELGSNQLTSLPKTFGNLSVLITLNLSRNALNKLPTQVLSLSSLKTLIVSNNTLSDLPKQLGAAPFTPNNKPNFGIKHDVAGTRAVTHSSRATLPPKRNDFWCLRLGFCLSSNTVTLPVLLLSRPRCQNRFGSFIYCTACAACRESSRNRLCS
jgi:Leucine-rich repeat (LRR) protein